MFGFSIPKIVLLLLLIFLIWQIFRVLEKKKKPEGLNNSSEEQNELVENSAYYCGSERGVRIGNHD